jgi:hypothetical protein
LIQRNGLDAKLFDWSDEITADCSRKIANKLNDLCGAIHAQICRGQRCIRDPRDVRSASMADSGEMN